MRSKLEGGEGGSPIINGNQARTKIRKEKGGKFEMKQKPHGKITRLSKDSVLLIGLIYFSIVLNKFIYVKMSKA